MKLFLAAVSILLFNCYTSSAQKTSVNFGKISAQDFVLPASSVIDSNTNAVIVADMGVTEFKGNNKGWFSYVFKRKTRIKILDKKAFELATVKMYLYSKDGNEEKLSDINAVTYNLENGNIAETKLEKNDLFSVRTSKTLVEKKFTLPAVKEGCIIEYSYTITSDYTFNMPAWEFQNIDYPCLWSEYQVTIPSLLIYIVQRRGYHPYFINKADEGHASYSIIQPADNDRAGGMQERSFNVSANTVKHRWVMKDVPAFHAENYLSTPANYQDRISFQLHKSSNDGETYKDVMNTWAKVTEELLKDTDFGSFMNGEENNFWMDKVVAGIIKPNTDQLQRARDIYYYIANNFTCTNHYNKYITTTLQDVYKKHSGTVGDLNLLLTALLQKALISASPVVLSTREHGFNYADYPVMSRLNYVICRARINDKIYCLDASHSDLGFGYLPDNCYNGHARIISNTDSASIYLVADSLKERKMTAVFINHDARLGFTGTFHSDLGHYESFNLREKLKGNTDDYFKNIKSAYSFDMGISEAAVDSLKQPESPLAIHYSFAFKPSPDEDIIYFNPMMSEGYKENPFRAAVRKYPVEMPYTTDETYVFHMDIPEGYTVEEIPASAKVLLNGNEGFFEYITQKSGSAILLRSRIKLDKATFAPEDYNSLREFFAYVVKKQGEQIVFKKKK